MHTPRISNVNIIPGPVCTKDGKTIYPSPDETPDLRLALLECKVERLGSEVDRESKSKSLHQALAELRSELRASLAMQHQELQHMVELLDKKIDNTAGVLHTKMENYMDNTLNKRTLTLVSHILCTF